MKYLKLYILSRGYKSSIIISNTRERVKNSHFAYTKIEYPQKTTSLRIVR